MPGFGNFPVDSVHAVTIMEDMEQGGKKVMAHDGRAIANRFLGVCYGGRGQAWLVQLGGRMGAWGGA